MTEWLNPTERRAWRTLVALTTRLPAAMDTQLQREAGMTHFEYLLMALLSEEPGHRLQLSELAGKANASLSRLSHVITKMERLGWARREVMRGRRGAYAVLTEAGCAQVDHATPSYLEGVRGLVFDGINDQQVEQLLSLTETLVSQLDEGLSRGIGRADGVPDPPAPAPS
ncbi:MarR family winged helix-turn-helix transcriptional regulator [Nocardia vermiculata]|uniref:MarR family winged helix-turn-helix transcriptional regulator n=1 Tax=Nocardia vermiculata TaxID=257274 RepID=UPI000AA140B1|nr:MarR family transcriptional regulator [Nocardia vermiculata]